LSLKKHLWLLKWPPLGFLPPLGPRKLGQGADLYQQLLQPALIQTRLLKKPNPSLHKMQKTNLKTAQIIAFHQPSENQASQGIYT
jgi:hypothetical protein